MDARGKIFTALVFPVLVLALVLPSQAGVWNHPGPRKAVVSVEKGQDGN